MEKFCEFKGEQIAIGKEFYDNCRAICRCEVGGVIDCHPIQCSRAFGPHTTKCLEWDIDPHFLPVAPNCCPEPKCKNGMIKKIKLPITIIESILIASLSFSFPLSYILLLSDRRILFICRYPVRKF